MHIYTKIYEFASSAGAFEGYVYGSRDNMDEKTLDKWSKNLLTAFELFTPEVRKEFQSSCNGTLGRAIHSLVPILGDNHNIVQRLKSMTTDQLPASADDFKKTKWFEE